MVRGRGFSPRGSYSLSNRGSSWERRGYNRSSSRDNYSYDNYDKGRFDRHQREEFPKPYRTDSYPRERHSPERKRPRNEGPSRHDYGGGRYESPYTPERRAYSNEQRLSERHHSSTPYSSRREEFRKPGAPPPAPGPRGGGRGRPGPMRGGARGPMRSREGRGGPRGRLAARSYVIRKRGSARGDFTRSSKSIRTRSRGIIRRSRPLMASDKEESSEDEELEESVQQIEKTEDDEEIKDDEEMEEAEVKEETEANEAEKKETKESKSPAASSPAKKRAYVRLICPQCNIKIPTFGRYEAHLQGKTHMFAMRKVAVKQRSILNQMRLAQRNAQNELEKSGESITDHTVFCTLCKLNYKQERAVHQATSSHKNMRKFLLPTCKVCKQNFKSPMVYEHHLCSVEHLKRKQAVAEPEVDEDNLDEFTTIDSIGEAGDDVIESAEEEKEKEVKRKRVSVGIEQVKRIEAYYCDLCRMFLPRGTENEYPDIIAGHCRKRFHMQRYVRQKENEALKKKAETLQRKETAEKEKKEIKQEEEEVGSLKKEDVKEEEGAKVEEKEATTSKSIEEDKLWDAVDKDLGELLEETDGRDDDDDEERMNGERYDRFRSAEKENEDGDQDGGEGPKESEKAEN